MDPPQFIFSVVWVVLLFLYGFFSEAQGALFSLKKEELEEISHSDTARSRVIKSLLKSPRETAVSLLILHRIFLLGVLVCGWKVWVMYMGHQMWPILFLILPFSTLMAKHLVVPRILGGTPMLYAHWSAYAIWGFHRGLAPLRWMVGAMARVLSSLTGLTFPEEDEHAIEREYLGLLEVGHREGLVESEEQRLIERVFELGDRPVSSVMTPRADMFCLPLTLRLDEAMEMVKEKGYSRVPVYEDDKDHIIGVLYAKDLLKMLLPEVRAKYKGLSDMLHEPFFVQEDLSIDDLLGEFQRRKLHMAICMDEFGGVSGLVTMEDLLEEIFGEIHDEYDLALRQWEPLDEGGYRISGKMPLEDLEDLLEIEISEPDCRTTAGFMLKRLGRLPKVGEIVEWNGLTLTAERVSGNRIQSILVKKTHREEM